MNEAFTVIAIILVLIAFITIGVAALWDYLERNGFIISEDDLDIFEEFKEQDREEEKK